MSLARRFNAGGPARADGVGVVARIRSCGSRRVATVESGSRFMRRYATRPIFVDSSRP